MNNGDRVKMDAAHFLYGRFTVAGTVKGRSVVLDRPIQGKRTLPLSRHAWVPEGGKTPGEALEEGAAEQAVRWHREFEEAQARALDAAAATGRQIVGGHAQVAVLPIGTRLLCHATGEVWTLSSVDAEGQCYGRIGDETWDRYYGNDEYLRQFSIL